MGSLLLYIPVRFAPSAGNLPDERARLYRDLGVQDLVTGRPAFAMVDRGPDGAEAGGGFVLPLIGDAAPAFHPDRQTWRRFEGDAAGSEGWFGWNTKEGPVGPDDLARPDMIAGHEVKLGDAQMWEIPVARRVNGLSALPQAMVRKRTADGRMAWQRGDVLAQHAALWAMAEMVWGAAMEGKSDLAVEECAEVACAALATNYRVCPALVEVLHLFDTESYRDIALAIIDMPTIRKFQAELEERAAKKNTMDAADGQASDGSPSSGGIPGTTQTTRPHAPTLPGQESCPPINKRSASREVTNG